MNNFIINLTNDSGIVLQNKLEKIAKNYLSERCYYIGSTAPLLLNEQTYDSLVTANLANDIFNFLLKIDFKKEVRFFFLTEGSEDVLEQIPIDFWKLVLSNRLPDFYECTADLQIKKLIARREDRESQKSRGLFVFPERLLPTSRAYFVRGLDLYLGLIYKKNNCDILVFGPNTKDLKKIESILSIFSRNVYCYHLVRGGLNRRLRINKYLEKISRRFLSIDTNPPMRFEERIDIFANEYVKSKLVEVFKKNPFEYILYTGAWFTPAVEIFKSYGVKLICDTHDVFFKVDETSNQGERRFFYYPDKEKKIEVDLLRKADLVIAISCSDNELFSSVLRDEKIIKESGNFEYARRGCDVESSPGEGIFGFIGTANNNNKKCLDIIYNDWSIRILKKNPNAKFHLAGAICKTENARKFAENFPNNVKLLGFVDRISDFYQSVDYMLSPIEVQGGLNFKSVESLIAGRFLLTNEVGAKCIADLRAGVFVVNSENFDEVLEAIMKLDTPSFRREISDSAAQKYGEYSAFSRISRLIGHDEKSII